VSYEFKLPDLGEGLTEGEIARWLVAEGDEIAEDAPLVEIATDKTTVEIPSPAGGVVSKILVGEGEIVPVGTVLVVIGGEPDGGQPRAEPAPGAEAEPAAPSASTSALQAHEGRVRATPLVRKLAQELGVDLAALAGSGQQGRITEEDVRRAAAGAPVPSGGRREPLRGVRRKIAEHLARAHREVPAVTVVEECDFTELERVRGDRSYLPYVLQATAAALAEYPELNATLDGDEIVYWDRYDVGVAVQTDEGLVVAVLHAADRKSIDELAEDAARLADTARTGKLKPEELRGSTFTITSAGRLSGLFATPLVNYPEVAILGVHRIVPRAVVRDGEIVVREVGLLSCTFDHRVVDGARASEFLLAVIARLERPAPPGS
jgi:pyruvate dehydrogenase E2 component (dihydrolipoamide acetyltransferase)